MTQKDAANHVCLSIVTDNWLLCSEWVNPSHWDVWDLAADHPRTHAAACTTLLCKCLPECKS